MVLYSRCALYGEKGILASRHTPLKTTYTDAKGEYSITTEISTDYHSGNIICDSFNKLSDKYDYTTGTLYFNGQQTKECCPVNVGSKNQYDFGLTRKKR